MSTVRELLAELSLADAGGADEIDALDAVGTGFLLVQHGEDGASTWVSVHGTPTEAAVYHDEQEGADWWGRRAPELVDVLTGARYVGEHGRTQWVPR